MKQIHDNNYQNNYELDEIVDLLSVKNKLDQKARINLYLPKIVVKLMDILSKDNSRGELVSALVLKEAQKKKKLPYGIFSPLEISFKEIKELTSGLSKAVNEAV